MDRSKKKSSTISGKKTRKRCFIRLSPTPISSMNIEAQEGKWYDIEDLYLLINKNGINPETGRKFNEEEIEKIRSLYENYDTHLLDLNDIPSRDHDIEPIYHNMEDIENMIEDQNMKIEENYSQILNLVREIECLKEKYLRN